MRCTSVRKMTEPRVSAEVIAEPLGFTKKSIYTWVAEKDFQVHRVGRLWKHTVTEVVDWVRSSGTDKTTKPSKKGGR